MVYKANAKTSNSLAVGSESQATGEGAVAVGRKNTSTGASSTVLGILSQLVLHRLLLLVCKLLLREKRFPCGRSSIICNR